MNVFKTQVDVTLTIAHELAMIAACQFCINKGQLFLMLSVYYNCYENIKSTAFIFLNSEMYLSEENVRKNNANIKM